MENQAKQFSKLDSLFLLEQATGMVNYFEGSISSTTIEELVGFHSTLALLQYKADLNLDLGIDNLEDDIFVPCEKLQKRLMVLIKQTKEE